MDLLFKESYYNNLYGHNSFYLTSCSLNGLALRVYTIVDNNYLKSLFDTCPCHGIMFLCEPYAKVRYHVNKYHRIEIITGCTSSYGKRINIFTRVYILN